MQDATCFLPTHRAFIPQDRSKQTSEKKLLHQQRPLNVVSMGGIFHLLMQSFIPIEFVLHECVVGQSLSLSHLSGAVKRKEKPMEFKINAEETKITGNKVEGRRLTMASRLPVVRITDVASGASAAGPMQLADAMSLWATFGLTTNA